MESKVVSYQLYGGKSIFGGRAMPYEFETTTCKHIHECSLYKMSQCARLERLSVGCPFCSVSRESAGYKSIKGARLYNHYQEVKEELKKEVSLTNFNGVFWKVGNNYCFKLKFIDLYRDTKTGNILLSSDFYRMSDMPDSCKYTSFVTEDELTQDLFNRIMNARPTSFMGNVIESYQLEIIPRLKIDLLKADPELAKKFGIEQINYIGKKAILKTLKPGITCWDDNKKYQLFWDGETITVLNSEKLTTLCFIGKYHSGEVKLVPNKDLTVIIEDNDWVLPDTIIR